MSKKRLDRIELFNLVKQRVIIALLADDELGSRLVLKGGNLLQFAYQLGSRASKDIDISVDGDLGDFDRLKARVEHCLIDSFDDYGMVLIDFSFTEVPAFVSEDIKSFWGGYYCEFKLIDRHQLDATQGNLEAQRRLVHQLHENGSPKFMIDFSRHEFCDDKEDFEIDGYTISGYSPRMFVAEKLRAICQQMPEYNAIVHRNRDSQTPRARDFLDIQLIANQYAIDFSAPEFHEIVARTFETKKVPIDWLARIEQFRDLHEPDFAAVRATVVPGFRLREFDFYFQFVISQCAQLKPLWNV